MRIQVNGVNLHVRDRGPMCGADNPALVLLHYFAGSSRAWAAVFDQVQSTHRCVAPDLRGFGDSSAPEFHYAVRDYADDVDELIGALGLESYILVGHSMGGKFAMALAARRPAGLEALVLIDPSPPTPEPMGDTERQHLLASHGDRAAMVELIRKVSVFPLPAEVFDTAVDDNVRSSRAAWRAWLELGSREDIAADIRNICVPALVLRGEDDPVMSRDLLEREVVGRIGDSRMVEVPGAGHLLPLRAPVQVAELIATVLA